jgi:hypothetical protein
VTDVSVPRPHVCPSPRAAAARLLVVAQFNAPVSARTPRTPRERVCVHECTCHLFFVFPLARPPHPLARALVSRARRATCTAALPLPLPYGRGCHANGLRRWRHVLTLELDSSLKLLWPRCHKTRLHTHKLLDFTHWDAHKLAFYSFAPAIYVFACDFFGPARP